MSGCAAGNTGIKMIAADEFNAIKAELAAIKLELSVSVRDVEAGNAESEGDVGGDVTGTKVIVGAGSFDSVALWLAVVGLVVALIAGPFGGYYYQKILRPKRMRKEGRCGECGKDCKHS